MDRKWFKRMAEKSHVRVGIDLDSGYDIKRLWIAGPGRRVVWVILAMGVAYAVAKGGCSGAGEFHFGRSAQSLRMDMNG